MSGSPSSGSKPDKTMSSRLLTMKFMQRAAHTAAAKDIPQPSEDSGAHTPKRQRNVPGQGSPATPSSDLEAISAALAAEEERRREAVARQAAEAGESEWVLDYPTEQYSPQPLVVAADSLDADDDDMVYGGRQAYGNFKRKKKTETRENAEDESEEEDDEDEDEDEDINDVEAMIKKAKSKASKNQKFKPPPGRVKLSNLTSISGGRQASVGGSKPQKKRKHK